MSITDTLKTIGIPATGAAIIGALVVTVPFLFQIDERYAKQSELEKEVEVLERKNDALQRELAQLTGFQQAMVTFIQEGRIPQPASSVASVPPRRTAIAPIAEAPPIDVDAVIAASPPAAAAPAIPPSGTFDPSVVKPEPKPVTPLEQPRNWDELNKGLTRQQQRLVTD